LLKYEAEIFISTGAWKSLGELEESISLAELFLLYSAYNNEFTKQVKVSAFGAGADVDFFDDWYDPAPVERVILDADNIQYMPISLGYETQ